MSPTIRYGVIEKFIHILSFLSFLTFKIFISITSSKNLSINILTLIIYHNILNFQWRYHQFKHHLKETLLFFHEREMSSEMIELLIENLPNLKKFGDFNTFDIRRPNDIKRFYSKIRDERWDIQLFDSQNSSSTFGEKDFNKLLTLHWFYLTDGPSNKMQWFKKHVMRNIGNVCTLTFLCITFHATKNSFCIDDLIVQVNVLVILPSPVFIIPKAL